MTLARRGRTRVLLIDDDEKLNALLGEYLARFNFAVHAVVHPDEGLRALRVEPPDIVILDIMLPDMDGFAVCRKLRERSSVPVILLTARGDVADRIAGLELVVGAAERATALAHACGIRAAWTVPAESWPRSRPGSHP